MCLEGLDVDVAEPFVSEDFVRTSGMPQAILRIFLQQLEAEIFERGCVRAPLLVRPKHLRSLDLLVGLAHGLAEERRHTDEQFVHDDAD